MKEMKKLLILGYLDSAVGVTTNSSSENYLLYSLIEDKELFLKVLDNYLEATKNVDGHQIPANPIYNVDNIRLMSILDLVKFFYHYVESYYWKAGSYRDQRIALARAICCELQKQSNPKAYLAYLKTIPELNVCNIITAYYYGDGVYFDNPVGVPEIKVGDIHLGGNYEQDLYMLEWTEHSFAFNPKNREEDGKSS